MEIEICHKLARIRRANPHIQVSNITEERYLQSQGRPMSVET
jgi:hypothetical protein